MLPLSALVAPLSVLPMLTGLPSPAPTPTPAPATAPSRVSEVPSPVSNAVWRQQAARALDLAERSAATNGVNPYAIANMARASARLRGWADPATKTYLSQVLALQHADGGWGIEQPVDAFGDGTINPADTTYTITTADHIGPLLLEAYAQGLVDREVLVRARDSLLTTPRVNAATSTCVAYSRSPFDSPDAAGYCVNNVNAATGWFLTRLAEIGIDTDGQRELAQQIIDYDASQQLVAHWWPYRDTVPYRQDADHNALNVEVHLTAGRTGPDSVGATGLAAALAAAPATDPTDPLAHLRIAPLTPATCSTQTIMAQLMIDGIPHIRPSVSVPFSYVPTVRYSQVAQYASRNAELCESRISPRPPRRTINPVRPVRKVTSVPVPDHHDDRSAELGQAGALPGAARR